MLIPTPEEINAVLSAPMDDANADVENMKHISQAIKSSYIEIPENIEIYDAIATGMFYALKIAQARVKPIPQKNSDH